MFWHHVKNKYIYVSKETYKTEIAFEFYFDRIKSSKHVNDM